MDHAVASPEGIVARLRSCPDAKEKLAIAGLIREPRKVDSVREECGNCIYYLANHRFCDLPEMQFPVDPDWWCLLWRV